jgi:pimeloyl-ACP methyl ester carboxylesterase
MKRLFGAAALAAAGLASASDTTPCPAGLPADTVCYSGRDEAGAYWWAALPPKWDRRVLVLHAHGGPELGAPKATRTAEDLQRWKVMVRAGYAWAGSSYRQGGVAVRAAAEDTERLRKLFVAEFGKPGFTVLHGQSWGASVAAIGAEMFPQSYDGVLLTNGVLGGGTQSYDFRLDLRVLWQAVCNNHPRPDEPQYPLWQGLPPGSALTRAELTKRVDECTGLGRAAAERTAEQQARLKTLLDVGKIAERSLAGHLAWGTWHFQDIVFQRLGGRNPFGNTGARYRGSADDAALNAKVARYRPDPAAVAAFAADADPQGRFAVPVLGMHAVDDPIAFVELESTFADTVARAGRADKLVQVFSADAEHSYLKDVEYVAAMQALLAWLEKGDKPTAAAVAAACPKLEAAWGAGCNFLPDYRPPPLAGRVPPRER